MAGRWPRCAVGLEDTAAAVVDSWLGRSLVCLQMLCAHTGFSSLPACSRPLPPPPPEPAFHISLTTAHSGVWEVQRPAGILQALVGLGSLWLMPWNVGLQPDTGSNLSRALALWEP